MRHKSGKRITMTVAALILCFAAALSLAGCFLFGDGNDIASVRERVETLRFETSDTLVAAINARDTQTIKSLFCEKTQELPDIDEQIEAGYEFLGGKIKSYKVSGSTSYEGYANDYGTVSEYDFGSEIFITSDSGKEFGLYFKINYITSEKPIAGMTFFNLYENKSGYEDYEKRMVGYPWSSPYDAEGGVITARLVKAIANKDENGLKKLLHEKTLESPTLADEIRAVFDFFDGAPVFTERADGLYDYSDDEKDFTCSVSGIAREEADRLRIRVIARPVCTDTGKRYELEFIATLSADSKHELIGIEYISVEDWDSDERVRLGSWE